MDIIYRINGGSLTLLANQTSPTNISGTAGDSVEVWLSEKQTATVQAASGAMENDGSALYWFEPSNGVTTSGTTLTDWADNTGNGNNLTQIGTLTRPEWSSGAVFTGVEVLGRTSPTFANTMAGVLDSGGVASAFVVANVDASGQAPLTAVNYCLLQEGTGTNASDNRNSYLSARHSTFEGPSYYTIASPGNRLFAYAYFHVIGAGANFSGSLALYEARVTQTVARSYVNGVLLETTDPVSASDFTDQAAYLAIGAMTTGTAIGSVFKGTIKEVFVTANSNSTTLDDIRSQLATKYSITI